MERIQGAQTYHARQSCYLCLNPTDGVDTDIVIEYEGALFICVGCCRALALTAGFIVNEDQSDKIASLRDSLEYQTQRADMAEAELSQLALYRERSQNLAKGRAAKAAKADA